MKYRDSDKWKSLSLEKLFNKYFYSFMSVVKFIDFRRSIKLLYQILIQQIRPTYFFF